MDFGVQLTSGEIYTTVVVVYTWSMSQGWNGRGLGLAVDEFSIW